MRKLANSAARDIASPAVKMGNRSLFPGVAVPLAFFCTLFFRHRKKSVSAPWDGQSQSAPESARQTPSGPEVCACGRTKGLSSGQTIKCPLGLQALLPRQNRRVNPRPLISTPSAHTPPKDDRTSHTARRSGSAVPSPQECSSPRPAPAARRPESRIGQRTPPSPAA